MSKNDTLNPFNGFWKFLTATAKTIAKFGPNGPLALACVVAGAFVSAIASDHFIVIAFLIFTFLVFCSFLFFSLFEGWQEKQSEAVKLEATAKKGGDRRMLLKQKVAARAAKSHPRIASLSTALTSTPATAALQVADGTDTDKRQTTHTTRSASKEASHEY